MKRTINAINDVASILGFRPANGTDTGARGFSVLDGFGRVQFVSFKVMCNLVASFADIQKTPKTIKLPFYDITVNSEGSVLVRFNDGMTLFYDKEIVDRVIQTSKSVSPNLYHKLQYAKKKNRHHGSYIQWSHFWGGVVLVSSS
ncbi:hypothetical protein [Aeromonas phage AS-yj]|uniref:Uncharacterized protein n=3 Tax=Ceceduovirus TaxID=2842588 RepID=A0A223LG39_9CAUD|nr:hypothetical protein HWB28_gp103 [Aeromonas phage AS-zj]YP_009835038.1 hypothetical protein HWB29_gp336 [Aeromonas phage AS-sw]ASU00449.1 hypothetical protein [Aeromonas phage AS-zj]ATI17960.1 hypothetical protein [Aeromonas phage AS-yj]ATI18386.1 hypothetical protein [Aeromonas phage AS-sw]